MNDLILFDLDGTLISGDSDFEWGNFMCRVGAVNKKEFQAKNEAFYKQYLNENLDIQAYQKFAFRPFGEHALDKLLAWRKEFIETCIKPMITAENKRLVLEHKQAGNMTVIITSTNRFVTEPIADLFLIDDLIASELEIVQGKYSGSPAGIPCYREGKIKCLEQWLSTQSERYNEIWFYSDSINDLPLLEYVDKAIVKNGDPEITKIAQAKHWQIL